MCKENVAFMAEIKSSIVPHYLFTYAVLNIDINKSFFTVMRLCDGEEE